eukprot:scaffold664934_cov94-Prasinocladus_malaysianus.AAC.1
MSRQQHDDLAVHEPRQEVSQADALQDVRLRAVKFLLAVAQLYAEPLQSVVDAQHPFAPFVPKLQCRRRRHSVWPGNWP